MQFKVSDEDNYTLIYSYFFITKVFNASEEVNDAASYPYLRLFTAGMKTSATQKYDLLEVEEKWSIPSKGTIFIFLQLCPIGLIIATELVG